MIQGLQFPSSVPRCAKVSQGTIGNSQGAARYFELLRNLQGYTTSVRHQANQYFEVVHNGNIRSCYNLSVTSYPYKARFLAVTLIKSKYCVKINVAQETRLASSSLISGFEKLCSTQQARTSLQLFRDEMNVFFF